MNNYDKYFRTNMDFIEHSLKSIDSNSFELLVSECVKTLEAGNKIIASGLGKNVPICDKFVGTMLSLGLNANFLHTNSAVHGDLGMVKPNDLVIILTKSGATSESVYLADLIEKRGNVRLWLLSAKANSILGNKITNKIIFDLEHEGDAWNLVPNNSTTVNLIVLQTVALEVAKRMNVTIEDFKPNHPGGAIGAFLKDV